MDKKLSTKPSKYLEWLGELMVRNDIDFDKIRAVIESKHPYLIGHIAVDEDAYKNQFEKLRAKCEFREDGAGPDWDFVYNKCYRELSDDGNAIICNYDECPFLKLRRNQ